MAGRSELSHRLLELKTSAMGKVTPRVLSRKSNGVDGLAKKLVAKSPPAAPDPTLAAELAHPDDVPEIVSGHDTRRAEVEPSRSIGPQGECEATHSSLPACQTPPTRDSPR